METRMEIIRRLGRAAEYRDNETGLHIIRMSKFSEILGRTAGMDADWCEMLLNASPMHDIGKIGIPDRILLKPGKFEPEEWEIMKTHAAIGAEILSGHHSDLMEMARVIAITHHEKWDGTGYPNGLKGEDIPLVGRIVALADVFDALTSERPYKKAWSVEDALGYLLENRGMHFDPNLVGVFEKVLPEILAVREQYAEPPAPSAGS
jgi:putative two-component system response regulator